METALRARTDILAHVPAPLRALLPTPGTLLFEQLVTAWALCPGRRTLTRLWSVVPAERRRRYGAYARWVREGKWSPDELWRCLVVQLVEHWATVGRLVLLLDNTLVNKSGPSSSTRVVV